jgi:hypothetical protein
MNVRGEIYLGWFLIALGKSPCARLEIDERLLNPLTHQRTEINLTASGIPFFHIHWSEI